MPQTTLPEALASAGITGLRDVDARPVLMAGGDPFQLIMRTLQALGPTEALHLMVPFEPAPLYGVLRSRGFAAHTERGLDVFHVYFFRDASLADAQAVASARVPLQAPVEMDVRGMEPPGPMMAILEKLVELGAGAQLVVRHHREPVMLYGKLEARGYAAKAEKKGEGDWVVRIAPAWALDDKKADGLPPACTGGCGGTH